MPPLESVPNVSEGRDGAAIAALAGAAEAAGAAILDVHSDADHHRSVLTLAAASDELLAASLHAAVALAVELIDLRRHEGVHPRVGAVDVIPIVPLAAADGDRAAAVARAVAARIASELGVPVFLYGDLAEGRRPAFFRRGGTAELQRRVEQRELTPDFGPSTLHPTAGASLVGVRGPLVAFNLELATDDVAVAREIAATVRASGGGLPGVQAIGLVLARAGRAQVSLNIVDTERAALHEVVAAVRAEAAARGTSVVRGELVGLVPAALVGRAAGVDPEDALGEDARRAAARAWALDELPASAVLEHQLAVRGLAGGGGVEEAGSRHPV